MLRDVTTDERHLHMYSYAFYTAALPIPRAISMASIRCKFAQNKWKPSKEGFPRIQQMVQNKWKPPKEGFPLIPFQHVAASCINIGVDLGITYLQDGCHARSHPALQDLQEVTCHPSS